MRIRSPIGQPKNPALRQHATERRASLENRIADGVTTFAGSMAFVYFHIVWFVLWIAIPAEKYPFGLLTMIVSLEAIFLSTFILISQNRADERRQVVADHQWGLMEGRYEQFEELIAKVDEVLSLTRGTHTGVEDLRAADRHSGDDTQ